MKIKSILFFQISLFSQKAEVESLIGQSMVLLNLYSISHFLLWLISGRFVLRSWTLFLVLSIGWEFLELFLPYEFAVETWDNKCADIIVNCAGFWVGLWWYKQYQSLVNNQVE